MVRRPRNTGEAPKKSPWWQTDEFNPRYKRFAAHAPETWSEFKCKMERMKRAILHRPRVPSAQMRISAPALITNSPQLKPPPVSSADLENRLLAELDSTVVPQPYHGHRPQIQSQPSRPQVSHEPYSPLSPLSPQQAPSPRRYQAYQLPTFEAPQTTRPVDQSPHTFECGLEVVSHEEAPRPQPQPSLTPPPSVDRSHPSVLRSRYKPKPNKVGQDAPTNRDELRIFELADTPMNRIPSVALRPQGYEQEQGEPNHSTPINCGWSPPLDVASLNLPVFEMPDTLIISDHSSSPPRRSRALPFPDSLPVDLAPPTMYQNSGATLSTPDLSFSPARPSRHAQSSETMAE